MTRERTEPSERVARKRKSHQATYEWVERETVERIAHIIGELSTAHRALQVAETMKQPAFVLARHRGQQTFMAFEMEES